MVQPTWALDALTVHQRRQHTRPDRAWRVAVGKQRGGQVPKSKGPFPLEARTVVDVELQA